MSVTIEPTLELDRRTAYEQFDGNSLIAREIIARLNDRGWYDRTGDVHIDVKITVFRLRSTANAFWNGFFAGVDELEGEIEVRPGSGQPTRYSFELSGSEEMYFKFSAGARFASLARELAAQLTTMLGQAGPTSRDDARSGTESACRASSQCAVEDARG